jgi:hypothetical protein
MPDETGSLDARKMQPRMGRTVHLTIALALAALVLAGCGEREETVSSPDTTTGAATGAATTGERPPADRDQAGERQSPPRGEPTAPTEAPPGDPRVTALEREAERTVREFVAALDAGDGGRACDLLGEGAIDELELPNPRGGCAASLTASIGYRDPRGLPVWQGAEVTQVRVVDLDQDLAKVLATVVTRFADRNEVSIEDDVVYLARTGRRWVVAKPSSTLYRAVGIADVPPSVLAPPSR